MCAYNILSYKFKMHYIYIFLNYTCACTRNNDIKYQKNLAIMKYEYVS